MLQKINGSHKMVVNVLEVVETVNKEKKLGVVSCRGMFFIKCLFVVNITLAILFSACQTNPAKGAVSKDNASSLLMQYLVPINNNILEGTIENFNKAVDTNLIDPILWIKNERAQMILTEVQVVAVNNYRNMPVKQVISVREIESGNEYSFFYFDITDGDSESTHIGDKIYILWTQGKDILADNDTAKAKIIVFNREDFKNTKAFDCFFDNNIWRVIFYITHDKKNIESFTFNWQN